MYWQEEEIQEARYQRWRAERWGRTYVEEFPEILWAGDFRSGRLARLAERRELLRVSAYGYVEPPPREWPRWRRKRYVDRARARAVALSIPETCAVGPLTVRPNGWSGFSVSASVTSANTTRLSSS